MPSSTPQKEENFVTKCLIAGCSCAVVSAILNPLDVTKIRMQTSKNYKGLFSGAAKILSEEGIAGWTRGLAPSMIREVSYSSVRIGFYEPIRVSMNRYFNGGQAHGSDASALVKFSSALLSGAIGSAIANPLDLIKIRFQASLPNEPPPYNNSTLVAFKTIIKNEGIYGGLYKGWYVTSARAALLTSAQLGSYDTIKNNILIKIFGFENGLTLHFISSMLAGLITTTVTNPVDVIKSRFMGDKKGFFKSPLHVITHTLQVDGPLGFFKGWTPAYWRLGPHTVMSFMLIENVRKYMGLSAI